MRMMMPRPGPVSGLSFHGASVLTLFRHKVIDGLLGPGLTLNKLPGQLLLAAGKHQVVKRLVVPHDRV